MATTQGMQKAQEILIKSRNRQHMLDRIRLADPYPDKRFAPVIANWIVKLDVTPEEHAEDIAQFKRLRRRLKDLRIPTDNAKRKRLVKELLSKGPDDFVHHYSALQEWNRQVSDILDPHKDLSDHGLPVVMRYEGYTMYRIDKEEHLLVPLVKNAMGWCVTKQYFGQYGGPPYYPIVRDRDREPFCMVIPAHFDEDPDQAVRNANNDGRISPRDLKLIRPLAQHVLPLKRHNHPYIKGVYGIKGKLPKYPAPKEAFELMMDLAIEIDEWPEGELAISKDPRHAYLYARDVLKGPFPQGEPAISQDAFYAYLYAFCVLRGPFLLGEPVIATSFKLSYLYARDALCAPFSQGEPAISRNPEASLQYATYVLKGPFPAGEPSIAQDLEVSFRYAKDVLKGPFPGPVRWP